ncbi:hypothetical protein U9M48_042813 [Paspalum notatum var. saurae]|uniref:Uncharacterized protein n=1 Tax=Paspalum notatum var. saurae TaxID=547442 RepID=A0AAQ3UTC8_PASNO
MDFDSVNELPPLELPLIEEPDYQDTEEQQPEGSPQTTNSASEETNPNEEGTPDPLSVLALLKDEQKFKLGVVDGTKIHIKQLKTCQGSKMGLTGQSGQVGRPKPGQVGRPRPGSPTH